MQPRFSFKERLVRTGREERYFQAREMAKEWGGLPSNVLLDAHTTDPAQQKDGPLVWREAWTDKVVVYLGGGRPFERADIVDQQTWWMLPASCIPEEAIGNGRALLYFTPESIEPRTIGTTRRQVVQVSPANVVVVSPLPILFNGWGLKDPKTHLPLDPRGRVYEDVPDSEKCLLFKDNQVRAAVRQLTYNRNGGLHADGSAEGSREVIRIERDLVEENGSIRSTAVTLEEIAILAGKEAVERIIADMTPPQLAALGEAAKTYLLRMNFP